MDKVVGYTYIVADILHTGHLLYLQAAKDLCDTLIVGVLTEDAILEKKRPPVFDLNERINLIKALKCVDVVVVQDKYSPVKNIQNIRPDILFESSSHDKFPSHIMLRRMGCEMKILPYYPEQSSSKIKKRIKNG